MPLPKRRSWNQVRYTNYLLNHQKQLRWIFWCCFDVCASGGNHYKSAMKLRYEPFSFTTSEFYNIRLISLIEWIHIKNCRTQKTVATCFCHRKLKIQKLRQVIAQFTKGNEILHVLRKCYMMNLLSYDLENLFKEQLAKSAC